MDFVLILSVSIYAALSSTIDDTINIKTNGPIEYCNVNPFRWNFEALSPHDIQRIGSLKQVHILARHGTRILPSPIKSIFPNSNQKFECHWKTVNTRYYKTTKDWMSFKLRFVDNEQIVEGNCAEGGSLKEVISQHRANAQMAKAFYIGAEPYQLMTQSKLNDIAGQLTYYNQLHQNVNIPEIKIISANYERTITSATVFMSEFLNINTPDITMELYTHDYKSDPYAPNKDTNCPLIAKYIEHVGQHSTQYKHLMKSILMNTTQQQWYKATGNNYSYDAGEGAVLMYCGGLDVPLPYKHFLNVLNISYRIREAILSNNETATDTCRLASSPMCWLFETLITNHIVYLRKVEKLKYDEKDGTQIKTLLKNDTSYLEAGKAKLIYHSVHDTSILFLLQAMGISNGREPMFAEMLTLEIYERSPSDPWYDRSIHENENELYENYLFRWTRKGKALAVFPGCEQEYKYTQSSLCSLSVLMDAIDYGENVKVWEKTCRNVTETYFDRVSDSKSAMKHHGHKHNDGLLEGTLMYLWTFLFGGSIGIAIMMFVNKYNAWFSFERWKYESI